MTDTLPSWAMEKAGQALGSPDFSRELLQVRIAHSLLSAYQQGKQDGQRETREQDAHKEAVIKAAIAWWEHRRPIMGWTEKDHIANPRVNCCNVVEGDLAYAIAAIRSQSDEVQGD